MTVPIADLLTQYTGTGSRTFFEYGFTVYDDSTVFVLVNGSPVTFTAQETGVVLDPAPALDDIILIYRVTDVTQLLDFQAFEAFKAAKTEWGVDKLILLKQEADLWRARLNLYADPYVERVDILNDKGTDPSIYLWNYDQAGAFSGEVTTQMPLAGQVVTKPWDFAYFQYGEEYQFRDYEVVYLMTQLRTYSVVAVAVDYAAKTYEELGTVNLGGERAIDIDDSSTFVFHTGATGDIGQLVWRGNCFSTIYSAAHAGANQPHDICAIKDFQKFLTVGEEAFGKGMRSYSYEVADPYSYGSTSLFTGNWWIGMFDLRFGNNGAAQKGDALLGVPNNGENLTTFKNVSGTITAVDNLAGLPTNGKTLWSCDRDSGLVTAGYASASKFRAYQIDMNNLTMTDLGDLSPTDQVVWAAAAVPGETDMFITCEDTGGIQDIVRTYRHDGAGGLTKLDEVSMTAAAPNYNAHFRISPYTKRIWLLTPGGYSEAYEVATDGTITQLVVLPYAIGTSGYTGNFIAFTENADGLYVTDNGFTGIKQKLYECWEMDETGSVTRAGSFGNADLAVLTGTVTNRTGVINNAADFSTSAIGIATNNELSTTGTFSFCLDVLLDAKGADRIIFSRGQTTWSGDFRCLDWNLRYISSSDRFQFNVYSGTTNYGVNASTFGSPSTATWYHIYCEYNRAEGKVKISVNDGTLDEAAATGVINSNAGTCTIQMGRGIGHSGTNEYHDGGVDQLFFFWDALTAAEQTWMYNSGNSRAFSEL